MISWDPEVKVLSVGLPSSVKPRVVAATIPKGLRLLVFPDADPLLPTTAVAAWRG
jgi:hypothetical protein